MYIDGITVEYHHRSHGGPEEDARPLRRIHHSQYDGGNEYNHFDQNAADDTSTQTAPVIKKR